MERLKKKKYEENRKSERNWWNGNKILFLIICTGIWNNRGMFIFGSLESLNLYFISSQVLSVHVDTSRPHTSFYECTYAISTKINHTIVFLYLLIFTHLALTNFIVYITSMLDIPGWIVPSLPSILFCRCRYSFLIQ